MLISPNTRLECPRKESVCGVVISYFPQGDLLARLRRIRPQVAHLLVIDNGSSGDAASALDMIESQTDIDVIRNPSNLGIAAALNQGVDRALNMGYGWVLTLDQDTVVADDMVQALSAVYEQFPEKANLAVIGSNYTDPVIRRPFLALNGDSDRSWQEVKTAITSGSLISLSAHRAIGPFREELFIDCIDFEYCLRARSIGFHVVMTRKPLMQHGIGVVTLHKLPWKTTGTPNHAPMRRYYIARNQLILARKYLWSEPVWTISTLYRHLKDIIFICLFKKDVIHKLKSTAMGVWDGFSSNFGRKPT